MNLYFSLITYSVTLIIYQKEQTKCSLKTLAHQNCPVLLNRKPVRLQECFRPAFNYTRINKQLKNLQYSHIPKMAPKLEKGSQQDIVKMLERNILFQKNFTLLVCISNFPWELSPHSLHIPVKSMTGPLPFLLIFFEESIMIAPFEHLGQIRAASGISEA